MSEFLTLLGIATEWHSAIGWTGVLAISGGAIFIFIKVKRGLVDLIANTPRSKEAQNGLREAVDETRDLVKENAKELRGHGERLATLEGYVLGKREATHLSLNKGSS